MYIYVYYRLYILLDVCKRLLCLINCDNNYVHITQPNAKSNCDVSFANSELYQACGHVTLLINTWPKYGNQTRLGRDSSTERDISWGIVRPLKAVGSLCCGVYAAKAITSILNNGTTGDMRPFVKILWPLVHLCIKWHQQAWQFTVLSEMKLCWCLRWYLWSQLLHCMHSASTQLSPYCIHTVITLYVITTELNGNANKIILNIAVVGK